MRKVVVWRDLLLPQSETFIAGQISALTHWQATLAGRRTYEPSLPVAPGFLSESAGSGRVRRAIDTRLRAPRAFARFAAREGFELMHAQFATDGLHALPLARRARLPLAVTSHGYDVTTARHAGVDLTPLFAYATSLIAVSEFIAGELRELGAPADKIRVLNIGIEVPAAPSATRRPDRVLFVGRLVEKKGCADLIRAVALLPQDGRPEVRVVGDGALRTELERLASQCQVRATFLGSCGAEVVRQEMSEATIFCGPSRVARDGDAEGFGMVFLEAAAAETPVVSYRSGGVAEAVSDGHTGILVDEGDVDALSRALGRLLQDPGAARELGQAGRRRVIEHFDIKMLTAALEEEYARVASARTPDRR